ncbi:hypothetical protein DT075_38245 [Bacillus licheniformis]|nr:hypothetical protein DT075_38245 [Bacillus licheniformis]
MHKRRPLYQTPVYWFSVPALFKKYIDEIYEYGLFYQGSEDYGRGGLFTDKKYMFSTTWNAPKDVFSKAGTFFEIRKMKNILIINGHEAYPHARGQLNHTIFTAMADKLSEKYEVKKTVVADGYQIPEEHEKFKWADAVILIRMQFIHLKQSSYSFSQVNHSTEVGIRQ